MTTQAQAGELIDTLVIGGGRRDSPRVGLRWLHSAPSSVLAGVGADAAYIVDDMCAVDAARMGR